MPVPQKILVIQQKMMGDVLASTVVCETLKEQYPDAIIHYLINSNTLPVIENNPHFDQIIEFKPAVQKSHKAFWGFIQHIKQQQYDLIVDVYGKTQSNLICLFSKAPIKISYHKWYSQFCYTKTVKRHAKSISPASKAIENRLRLVVPEAQLISAIKAPQIFLTEQEQQAATQLLDKHQLTDKNLVMISILGSGANKSLPAPYMAALIDHIAAHNNVQLIYNYMPNQIDLVKEIHDLTQAQTQKVTHLEVYGKGLRSFLALLASCQAIIGNEGGAMNMAKALGIPTFTVFSPWIEKNEWNMFENDTTHQSVHLSDFRPDLYINREAKLLKKQATQLYQLLQPKQYKAKLLNYYQVNQYFQN